MNRAIVPSQDSSDRPRGARYIEAVPLREPSLPRPGMDPWIDVFRILFYNPPNPQTLAPAGLGGYRSPARSRMRGSRPVEGGGYADASSKRAPLVASPRGRSLRGGSVRTRVEPNSPRRDRRSRQRLLARGHRA